MTGRAIDMRSADPLASAGLTQAEAERRLARYGRNEVAPPRPTPLHRRVLAQLRDPLILVLLGAALLTIAIGDHPDAVVIGLVVVFTTTVGVTQEVRADRAVATLSALAAPHARVRRDGGAHEVSAALVVPGDSLLLGEGDSVAADADLTEASALLTDESMLTGESEPVAKDAGDTVSAGTVVVRGRAVATATATGSSSALGRIAALFDGEHEPTPLQRRLASLGRVLAAVTLALCVLFFALGLIRGLGVSTMAITAISLAVAAVPESLPAVVTLALALGARRMAARGALIRRLPAVETLGSVSVLATDKTGTLTEGRMVVQHVWTPAGAADVSGNGYEPRGDLTRAERPLTPEQLRPLQELLTAAALCNDASLRPPGSGSDVWTALGDPMEAALLAAAAKAGCPDPAVLHRDCPRLGEAPFDSLRKRMTTLHHLPDGNVLVCLKGAPEAVLAPTVLAEPAGILDQARRQAAEMAAHGFRVLAVAGAERLQWSRPAAEAEHGLSLLGLVAISDPPKAAAAATLAACRAAGIAPVMITGDHPATAHAIALRIGLVEDGPAGTAVTGPALAAAPDTDLTAVRVFARTDPQQKLDIVRAGPPAPGGTDPVDQPPHPRPHGCGHGRRTGRAPGHAAPGTAAGTGAWQRLLVLAAAVTAFSLMAGIGAHSIGLPWQSVLFLSLLGAQLGVALGLRARLLTTQNLFLPASVAASALLAMAALYVPALQSLLDTRPVGWTGTGLAVAAALAAFVTARLLRGAFHRKA
ncbi:HAD-IC family P-type ATPase [Streptomyces lavendulae]